MYVQDATPRKGVFVVVMISFYELVMLAFVLASCGVVVLSALKQVVVIT